MPHLRSKKSRKRRQKKYKNWFDWKKQTSDIPRGIVLNFSLRDDDTGEIIWVYECKAIIEDKLKNQSSDNSLLIHYTDHEFGEVLNRFPIRPFNRAEGMMVHGNLF